MNFPTKSRPIGVVLLVTLFAIALPNTVHGVDQSKDFVDWPIVQSSGDRTPALLPRADQSSIQFQVGTGFDGRVIGSDAGKSQGYQCTSPFDQRCVDQRISTLTTQRWKSLNQLPICLSPRDNTPCIERILISESNGEKYALSPSGTIPGYQWPANKAYGSPAGALTNKWKSSKDSEGSGFILSAQINIQGSYKQNRTDVIDFKTNFLRYELTPLTDPYLIANQWTFCLWVEKLNGEDKCARQKFLDTNSLITITYHLPKEVTGWFAGRMSDASLTIESIDSDFNSVTVSAYPVEVPVFAATIPCVKGWVPCGAGVILGFTPSPLQDYIQSLQVILKDQATFEIPTWGLRSTNKRAFEGCEVPEKGFAGLIFSNASFVNSFPPIFEDEMLRYEMGALHLKSDGSVFKGNFDMFIESGFARCLWKLSKAPVQASISVTSKDGNQNIATTSLGERNGFIRMKAAGFTFSTSTVEMKLQNKQTTISCVKGKTVKKVTAVKPTCPTGFKKK